MNKKILLAVSGGPDSMYLLNKYRKKNIVVATVNYNQRFDSHIDYEIVKNFCITYKIDFEGLNLKKDDYKKGNFQNWARERRYKFFKEVYLKYNCDKLFIAHNIDDFLETAIFQKQSKRFSKYYGIKKHNILFDMNIERPLLFRFFKKTIIKKNLSKGIPFHKDYTNEEPKYSRNKIRIHNNEKPKILKIYMMIYFFVLNFILKLRFHKVDKNYKKWKENNFSQDTFQFLTKKEELVYELINNNFKNVKLSKDKIKNIIKFIESSKRSNKYKLSENCYLTKKRGYLLKDN
ncbi:tRNA lysidine(34) synthetase TilS [Mycoplasmopsis canis]|uniref:tRNA lysidine(34) synthetase TilS n=1 Tax=Mycoplasmopsis canis TaxID=29555 RepID=UPI00025ADC68|nr:tRNA lysidine(34) synthetase TilS [Mycoplasmopsis canis]EIE41128.1 hypothetical protein MCANUF33_00065 [Mycoplasmopsis canis UF33]